MTDSNIARASEGPQTPPSSPDIERDLWESFPEYPTYRADIQRLRWPPGFLGQIAKYLFGNAASPVPEYAIATAIGFFAGICGRGWIYSGTGLNHDIVVVGNSGTGKNIVHSGVANISRQLGSTAISTFIVPAKMASAQALIKNLNGNPCFLQLIGEVGKMYRAYAKSRHGDTMDELFTVKLDLWERSGPDGVGVGILYSDAEKNIEGGVVTGIAHSTLGESTPGVFYGAITEDMMNQGLLSRLWIIEYEGEDPAFNERRLETVPADWVRYLGALVTEAACRIGQQPVKASVAAVAMIREFAEQCRDEKRNAGDDPAQRQLWVRAYEKVIRLAALLAVADNYIVPEIQVEHVDWAIGLLIQTNHNVQRRKCDGDISEDSDHTREQMIIQRCQRFLAAPRTNPKQEQLRANLIIPRRYLQQELSSKQVFIKHPLKATAAFNIAIRNLVENGQLMEVNKDRLFEMYGAGTGQCYRWIS